MPSSFVVPSQRPTSSVTEVRECHIRNCGCPGDEGRVSWCDALNNEGEVNSLVTGAWCARSESNCADCGASWCVISCKNTFCNLL